eukprot:GFKZ01005489.1.p1 GENE.GFKZ01005489.1~~GFKZ01005489.1.p1  ORF type:complete len:422 (-),score=13.49 GFKZ01005489.1:442-1602(-)
MTHLHLHLTRAVLLTVVLTHLTHLTSAQTVPFSRAGLTVSDSNPFGSDDSSGQLDTVVCGMRCEDNCRRKFLLTPTGSQSRSQLAGSRFPSGSVSKGRNRRVTCGADRLMSEARCDHNCKKMTAFCRKVASRLKTDTSSRQKVRVRKNGLARFSVAGVGSGSAGVLPGRRRSQQRLVRQFADESWECDDTYYLWGLECIGVNCEEIYLVCVLVLMEEEPRTLPNRDSGDPANAESVLCRNLANPGEYGVPSEPFGPNDISEVVPGPVCGVNCMGRNCAKKELVYVGGVDMLGGVDYYTEWFSSDDGRGCPDGMVVSQVECGGPFCTWICLGCQRVGNNIVMGNMHYRGPGGQNTIWCEGNEYLTGMSCLGRHCAQIELWCTELECA